MKKKTKFMIAILSRDEWEEIQEAMLEYEQRLDSCYTNNVARNNKALSKFYLKHYLIVKHFNNISVDTIEELADKIEKQRKKERRKCPLVQAKKES